jgi:macrolide-specific efflux system membrane fusion protein
MKNKTIIWVIIIAAVAAAAFFFLKPKKSANVSVDYTVKTGSIKVSVSTSGTVLPQNRLEIKPPLAGRIESILVVEGQYVKKGQTLAYMSSSDRAALLDAARAQGEANLKEWEDTYKPIPLIAPINGEVIVRAVEPGQSVTSADAVLVLSDRLIIQAQVDETDIGKIKLGQKAAIVLDAYSDQTIDGKVDHVYYESKTVNNVTMYNVDILPDRVPSFFRSGMSANIDVIREKKDNILILPVEAVKKFKDKSFVFMKSPDKEKPERREVVTGISDDDNIEIISGLNEGDVVTVSKQNYTATKTSSQPVNPFMPARPARTGGRGH